jgi:hypothetical protein
MALVLAKSNAGKCVRWRDWSLVLATTLLALSGCKRQPGADNAVSANRILNATQDQVVPIDTLDPSDNRSLASAGTSTARPLRSNAPDSVEAASDTLHRAIALIQTDRLADLRPMLTAAANAQLSKAGGDSLLRRYKMARVEFADKAVIDPAHLTTNVRFRLHIDGGDIRLGEAVLRRTKHGTADPWQIDSVQMRDKQGAQSPAAISDTVPK